MPVEITPAWGLRDIRPGYAYSICNTIFCPQCESIFCDMRFEPDEMQRLYAGYRDITYTSLREQFEPGYTQRNASLEAEATYLPRVEQFLSPHVARNGRILDWGGGSGVNTPFRLTAATHHVFDISRAPTIPGATNVTGEAIRSQCYDLIVLSEVLEHVSYPNELLHQVSDAMTHDTILYIEVPYEDLVKTSKNIGKEWPMKKHWHEHINFFSERSLECLLENNNLRLVEKTTFDVVAGLKSGTAFAFIATTAS